MNYILKKKYSIPLNFKNLKISVFHSSWDTSMFVFSAYPGCVQASKCPLQRAEEARGAEQNLELHVWEMGEFSLTEASNKKI